MQKIQLLFYVILILVLSACGKESQPNEQSQEESSVTAGVTGECGKGGTECPAGLECVTWRDGSQGCGPMSVESTVLIKDTTLGGGCISPNPADPLPGASIASVQVVGNDGKVSGYGRYLWDKPGFEVATDRGTPPHGSGDIDDACANYYNLGCDGQAVFEIIDDGGEVQKMREGQVVVVHMRGQETCGEEIADAVEGAICNDPAATASGDLSSCTFRVRMIEASDDIYGPDRVGGTIQYIAPK